LEKLNGNAMGVKKLFRTRRIQGSTTETGIFRGLAAEAFPGSHRLPTGRGWSVKNDVRCRPAREEEIDVSCCRQAEKARRRGLYTTGHGRVPQAPPHPSFEAPCWWPPPQPQPHAHPSLIDAMAWMTSLPDAVDTFSTRTRK
jgi:hypothetical protein